MQTFPTTLLPANRASADCSSPWIQLAGTRSLRELHEELRECQARLGTSAEREADLDRARRIAHEINNRIQAGYLRSVVSSGQFCGFFRV